MTVVRQPVYGTAEALVVDSAPLPKVGDDDVRIRVRAASLNFGDRMVLTGRPWLFRPLAYGLRRPGVPIAGMAAAGVVVEVGPSVTDWVVGDPVFGELARGALADQVLARSSELARKPEAITFEAAATLPVAAATALRGLRDIAGVKPGHRVLINGASGGVGTFAVQIGKALGATVTAVCSGTNVAQAQALGADAVIDYTERAYVDADERFDVVFDLVGNHPLGQRRRVLDRDGVYVASFGQGGDAVFGPLGRILWVAAASMTSPRSIRVLSAQASPSDLADVAELVRLGKVRPVVEARYPLAEAPSAYARLLEGHLRGKLVIAVDDPRYFGPPK